MRFLSETPRRCCTESFLGTAAGLRPLGTRGFDAQWTLDQRHLNSTGDKKGPGSLSFPRLRAQGPRS